MIKNKKKLLYVVEAMGGGVFSYIVDLSNKLCEEFDIYIAYAIRPQTPEDYKDYFDERITLIEVKNFTRAINFTNDIKAFFEIRSIAKSIQPDVIHLHSSKAGVLGRWAFNGKKIPLYYTPHGYSFLMEDCSKKKRIIYKLIESICGKRRCTTIACSPGEYNESEKLVKNAICINNGVNTEFLDKFDEKKENNEDKITVYTLGRICKQKNPKLFNEIALMMPDIQFIWIGDGELRNQLTSKNIEVTGWVTREEALRHTQRGNVFLLTSLWEGLPISLLESMYMKKECIVSNVIGNRDVINDGVNGYICSKACEFVEKLRKLSTVNDNNIKDNAYMDVINNYTIENMSKKYYDIYTKNRIGE